MDAGPLLLTFKLALISTLVLLVISLPLAYWLAFTRSKWRFVIEALTSMPLVLPPTVLGFYLLLLFSPQRSLGGWLDRVFHIQLVFSFGGLVLGSVIYSLPFMVQPIQSAFKGVPKNILHAAVLLGKNRLEIVRKVILPNSRAGLLTGIVLAFAHTIGEFGVVLMLGGNIPDRTRVASIAIFEEVEALNYSAAGNYSAILFAITFLILLLVYTINGRFFKAFQP